MPAEAFAQDFPLAVESAERLDQPLALVLIRNLVDDPRAAARTRRMVAQGPGFSYELQPDAFAILLPGSSREEARETAWAIVSCARRGAFAARALLDAAAISREPGDDPEMLFQRAATALSHAHRSGGGLAGSDFVPA